MQTTQNAKATTPSTPSGTPVAQAPKSAPTPIGSDLFKHISGGTPYKTW